VKPLLPGDLNQDLPGSLFFKALVNIWGWKLPPTSVQSQLASK
jgi:hypothetical protein